MNSLLRNTLFFVGWVLSPLTFWNDAFVNIPLSYLIANFLARFVKCEFLMLVLAAYWLTNVVGLGIMYLAGQDIGKGRAGVIKGILSLLVTSAVYSLIIIALARLGIIKPL